MSSTKIKDYTPGCVYVYKQDVVTVVVSKDVGIAVYPEQAYICPPAFFCIIDGCRKIIKHV